MSMQHPKQRGLTLVELIVSIVVIAISVSGILLLMNQNTRSSADPAIQRQALAIAESYMEEILLQRYLDPDTSTVCPAAESSRILFDNVCDYHGLSDSGAKDQTGASLSGLDSYTIQVAVDQAATLGTLSGSAQLLRVDVSVTPPFGQVITLSGYRSAL